MEIKKSIPISAELHAKLQAIAEERGQTLRVVTERALLDWLSQTTSKVATS